jgi:hypothetical protein
MIGAIAESVGALGVIASLAYLAIQIRDGTRATRRTNAHDVNESFRAWWAQLSESEETASVWQQGCREITSRPVSSRGIAKGAIG